jgi:hypothetical protein
MINVDMLCAQQVERSHSFVIKLVSIYFVTFKTSKQLGVWTRDSQVVSILKTHGFMILTFFLRLCVVVFKLIGR